MGNSFINCDLLWQLWVFSQSTSWGPDVMSRSESGSKIKGCCSLKVRTDCLRKHTLLWDHNLWSEHHVVLVRVGMIDRADKVISKVLIEVIDNVLGLFLHRLLHKLTSSFQSYLQCTVLLCPFVSLSFNTEGLFLIGLASIWTLRMDWKFLICHRRLKLWHYYRLMKQLKHITLEYQYHFDLRWGWI